MGAGSDSWAFKMFPSKAIPKKYEKLVDIILCMFAVPAASVLLTAYSYLAFRSDDPMWFIFCFTGLLTACMSVILIKSVRHKMGGAV